MFTKSNSPFNRLLNRKHDSTGSLGSGSLRKSKLQTHGKLAWGSPKTSFNEVQDDAAEGRTSNSKLFTPKFHSLGANASKEDTPTRWLNAFSTEGFDNDKENDRVESHSASHQRQDDEAQSEDMMNICLALANPCIDNDAWNAVWFREQHTTKEVENTLRKKPDGYFIIHNNISEKALGFSYVYDKMVRHSAVNLTKDGTIHLFGDSSQTFLTLSDLVHHYTNNWTTEHQHLLPCKLAEDLSKLEEEVVRNVDDEDPFILIEQQFETPSKSGSRLTSKLSSKSYSDSPSILKTPTATPSRMWRKRTTNGSSTLSRLASRRKSLKNVSFDEASIKQTKRELELHRGIYTNVDAAAREAPYFLGDLLAVEAGEILNEAQVGMFIIYNHPDTDTLNLAYVSHTGAIVNTFVYHIPGKGIHLDDAVTSFRTLSQLVAFYASDNAEWPNLLRLPEPGELVGESWMHPNMNRQQAKAAVIDQANGTFVVRTSRKGDARHVISYVHDGKVYHAPIEESEGQLKIRGSLKSFATLSEMIMFYSSTSRVDLDLRTALKVPDDPMLRSGLHHGPQWLLLGIPKSQILGLLDMTQNGSFLIRSSESRRENLVLSYVFRGTMFHEHIITKQSQNYLTTYSLQKTPDLLFHSLADLVDHHMGPGRGLKCPLYKSDFSTMATKNKAIEEASRLVGSRLSNQTWSNGSTNSTDSRFIDDNFLLEEKVEELSEYPPILRHVRIDQAALESPWLCMHLTKEQAFGNLDKSVNGSFVIRRNTQLFATLSLIVGGRILNQHIIETSKGLALKKSRLTFLSLSAFVHHYTKPLQEDLPQHLVLPKLF